MPAAPLCVYCRQRAVDPAWRPFCSERCKMADLGRWLRGDYRVPGAPADTEPRRSGDNGDADTGED